MTDIRIVWDPAELVGDWLLSGSQLDTRRALVTAIAVSLFTDGLAYSDDRLPDENDTDRRGWWGDHERDLVHGATQNIGSRLWLLSREKQTDLTRQRAEEYCREALQWLTRQRVATAVEVKAYWFAHERLGVEITVIRGGADDIEVRFQPLWDELGLAA